MLIPRRLRLTRTLAAVALSAVAWTRPISAVLDQRVADRVLALTRDSAWRRVAAIAVSFRTFHPQGMVRVGNTLVVSAVEVKDRSAGQGTGHLFAMTLDGALVGETTLGEGAMYHPGGIDFDGTDVWVPVAEYRPDSRTIVYRVDPRTLKAVEVFRAADHIGGIVHDTDTQTLHGVSWGSRRFYRWTMTGREEERRTNPSHYIDYQDCKYAGRSRMLCSGTAEYRPSSRAAALRLGGLELIDLRDGRPIHQVPVPLWTDEGLDMTHNPMWIEPAAAGLRAYFMPDDDRSTLFIYDVTAEGR